MRTEDWRKEQLQTFARDPQQVWGDGHGGGGGGVPSRCSIRVQPQWCHGGPADGPRPADALGGEFRKQTYTSSGKHKRVGADKLNPNLTPWARWDDDNNKPIWPTWAVGALFKGVDVFTSITYAFTYPRHWAGWA
jgi:hypothetical protein